MQASVAKARKYGQRRRISATRTATTSPADRRGGQLRRAEVRRSVYARGAPSRGPPGDEAGEPAVRDGASVAARRARRSRRPSRLRGEAHRGAARTTTSARAGHGRSRPRGARSVLALSGARSRSVPGRATPDALRRGSSEAVAPARWPAIAKRSPGSVTTRSRPRATKRIRTVREPERRRRGCPRGRGRRAAACAGPPAAARRRRCRTSPSSRWCGCPACAAARTPST